MMGTGPIGPDPHWKLHGLGSKLRAPIFDGRASAAEEQTKECAVVYRHEQLVRPGGIAVGNARCASVVRFFLRF